MSYVAYYPLYRYGDGIEGVDGAELGGLFSGLKKLGKNVAKVVATPLTVAAKTHTYVGKVFDIPYADTLDRYVSKASIGPVNRAIEKITDIGTDLSCKALMDKYISTGITIGIGVVTSGAGALIFQGGKQVASGMCAKRMAEALAAQGNPSAQAAVSQMAIAEEAQAAQAVAEGVPIGAIAYRQRDGMYRIAMPRGFADVGAPTHEQTAISATLPQGVTEVDKATFERATTPFYARTTFLMGAGFVGAAAILGGIAVAKKRRRR